MIATILLVAITVALAVALWVAITTYFKVPASIDLASSLSVAAPSAYGEAGPGCFGPGATCFWYNISISSTQNGVTASSVTVGVLSSSGGPVALQNASLTLENRVGVPCQVAVYNLTTNTWTASSGPGSCSGANPNSPLSPGEAFVLMVAGPASGPSSANLWGHNYAFTLFGVNGFTGSTSTLLGPPTP